VIGGLDWGVPAYVKRGCFYRVFPSDGIIAEIKRLLASFERLSAEIKRLSHKIRRLTHKIKRFPNQKAVLRQLTPSKTAYSPTAIPIILIIPDY
jgi:hypothetical protein